MKRCGGSGRGARRTALRPQCSASRNVSYGLLQKNAREVRGVLKRLAIDVTRLRGRWLVLAEG
eukprot:12423870-Karenia_brevis.AAC.1